MQLINITTIPISIELKSSRAQLRNIAQQPSGRSGLNISRQKGGLQIKSDPIKIRVDSTDMWRSMGIKPAMDMTKEAAGEGTRIAYEATARYAEAGNYIADAKPGSDPITELASQYYNRDIQSMLAFIPSVAPNISWADGTLNIKYNTDKLNIDWNSSRPEFEFIPPSIELSVLEYPSVIIEYTGSPIYVPASANPKYEGNVLDIKI